MKILEFLRLGLVSSRLVSHLCTNFASRLVSPQKLVSSRETRSRFHDYCSHLSSVALNANSLFIDLNN